MSENEDTNSQVAMEEKGNTAVNNNFSVAYRLAFVVLSLALFSVSSIFFRMFDNGSSNIEFIFVLLGGFFGTQDFGFGLLSILANPAWAIAAFLNLQADFIESLLFSIGALILAMTIFTMDEVDYGIFGGPFGADDLAEGFYLWLMVIIAMIVFNGFCLIWAKAQGKKTKAD